MARIADLLAAGRTFSFEFFPPKTDGAQLSLGRAIGELEPLAPSFVSVTYGAGGSTRQRTHAVVSWMRKETTLTPMAHLTCQGHVRAEIREILNDYAADGVENILALGGDVPTDGEPAPSDYTYAHPELHPRSPDRATDRKFLAAKLSRADFAITQFFFDLDVYVQMVNELADLGVTKPILPGIMPVTNKSQIRRMAELSGAAFPAWLAERLDRTDDAEEIRRIGVDAATELCQGLLDAGAPGLHFYTMNRSTATSEIYANLGLSPTR